MYKYFDLQGVILGKPIWDKNYRKQRGNLYKAWFLGEPIWDRNNSALFFYSSQKVLSGFI